jgi:WD40 repeat protein
MSYCINPQCLQPNDPANVHNRICRHCGSQLLLQNRYRVTSVLSDCSGFAIVYEVLDGETFKILKALKPKHNDNPRAVELFQQEALVLAQLDLEGIPKVEPNSYFQYFPRDSSEPIHCFIMEKIDGPNLKEWMNQQGELLISEQQALNWLKQLVEILHVVHQKNYFHRDIKLQNIMLRPDGKLVLIDFGAAREMTYTYLAHIGSAGKVTKISSAGYTPPEQEKGHAVPQSDFFALGRTFAYLLTGKQLTDNNLYDPLTDEFNWREYAPDISSEFADFIDRLMAPKAVDRPKDTQEIIETINQLLNGRKNDNPPENGRRIPVTKIQLSPDSPTIPQTTDRASFLFQGLLKVATIAVLILGGYGSWNVYHRTFGSTPIQQIAIAKTLTGHESFVNDLAISPDGQHIISASADRTLKIWDILTGKLLRTLTGHTSFINHLVLSPDGQWLVSASADKTIKIWDIDTGKLLRTLTGHSNYVNHLAIAPDGQTLVSTGADDTIKIWDLVSAHLKYTLSGHTSFINIVAIAPDGQTLASGSADKTVKIWHLKTGKELYELTGHSSFINTLIFSPDGELLISGSADKTIKIWHLKTKKLLRTLSGHTGFINDLAISPDGKFLASSSADKTIKIWDLATGEVLHTLTGHSNYVNQLTISQDGQILVSCSADKTIRFWNLATGKETSTLVGYDRHIDYFAMSSDGKTVATGSGDKNIDVWQLRN